MSSVPKSTQVAEPALILFDGPCALCQRSVRFVHRFDRRQRFRFCALQSPAGRQLLEQLGLPESYQDSVLLLVRGPDGWLVRERSAAVFGILAQLGLPWSLLRLFACLPVRWTDALYDAAGARRQRWFGQCVLRSALDPELMDRFVADGY